MPTLDSLKYFLNWKFLTGAAFAIMFGWLVISNANLKGDLAEESRDRAVAEASLGTAIDQNKQLQKVVARLQVGEVINEQIVRDNQLEINKLEREHNVRVQEVNRQKPDGPASPAVICAITRVCN